MYLKQSFDYGLKIYLNQQNNDKTMNLVTYDAAYMAHPDASSHSGYCIAIGSEQPRSYVYSQSRKQKCIATSSTHAEIRALYELTINLVPYSKKSVVL